MPRKAQPQRIDVHQHLWTEPLLDALAARDRLPFVRRSDWVATVHCAGEQAWTIDLKSEALSRRVELLQSDGIDLAIVALSSPIGIEALPDGDARPLIEAYLTGIDGLGNQFAAWGPVALERPDPADVDDVLARGCVGISLPAGALAGPEALAHIGPLLERASELQAPLFVHPGPAQTRHLSLNQPLWWPALTDYVAQMQAAWFTFATVGRREHPHLFIVFALLAGGAPLLSERLEARGGSQIDLRDPLTFYETSSFGPLAIESMATRVGAGQLLYGSDRPVLEPSRTPYDDALKANAARLVDQAPATPAVAA